MANIVLDDVKLAVYKRWIGSYYWLFLKDCMFTSDERYAGRGLMSRRSFPAEERYLQYLWYMVWKKQRIAINKFRQGFMTWLLGGALPICYALFVEGSKSYILKRAFGEADAILKTKCMFIYDNIPELIRIDLYGTGELVDINPRELLPEMRFKEGEISVIRRDSQGKILPASNIYALEAGPDKARGVTGSYALIDEAAFTDRLIETVTAMDPAMEKMVLLSSPRMSEFRDFFYSLKGAELGR